MTNIFKIHPLYYLFLIIIILTANIRLFIEFSILLLVHELGHILAALFFKWKIDRIVILPYGLITFFKNSLNKPIYQEFIILIMGPLFQIIFNYFFPNRFNLFLLTINLLPIYPLDGSKLLFLLFNKITSYYHSYILVYIISFIIILYLLITCHNLIIILMIFYLIYHLIEYIINLNNTILLFCYERFKCHFFSKKIKYLKYLNLKYLYRSKYHYFKVNNNFVKEEEIFLKMFDK